MKKGFTLIELLAVIIILGIIALIATPIVMNVIEETKENALLRSAEFYLDAVEQSKLLARSNGIKIKDGIYNIMSDGNICLGTFLNNECDKDSDILKVEVDGDFPTSGKITFEAESVKDIKLKYDEITIRRDYNGKLVIKDYLIGDEIIFNPGDKDRIWNVIGEDKNTLTLLLNENLIDTQWMSKESYVESGFSEEDYGDVGNNNIGPITALTKLNELTSGWTNIDPIVSYTYLNNENGTTKTYGYQKLEIKDGIAKLTSQDGNTVVTIPNETKARLISIDELLYAASQINNNLTKENLKTYLEQNFDDIKLALQKVFDDNEVGITIESENADDFLSEMKNKSIIDHGDDYLNLYMLVSMLVVEKIGPNYDVSRPKWFYQNLNDEGYWLLSTYSLESDGAATVDIDCLECSASVNFSEYYGIRPVIRIPKSKLEV